jgi:hypothetical protein
MENGQIHDKMVYNYNFEISMICLSTVNIPIWLEMQGIFVNLGSAGKGIR